MRLAEALPPREFETIEVPEGSPAAGESIRGPELRTRTGATLLAVRREGRLQVMPPSDFPLKGGQPHPRGDARQVLAAARTIEGAADESTNP